MLSAVVAGAFAMDGLHAQDGPARAASPQLNGDYALTGSAACLHSASAACRRKPRFRPPSGLNADFSDNTVAPMLDGGGASLYVHGDAAALRLDVRQTTITGVLSALGAAFNIRYRSSIALDEVLNGTYTGSLGRVVSQVLDGHNYVIKQEKTELTVLIFGKAGEQAVAAPAPRRVRDNLGCRVRGSAQLRAAINADSISPCP
jgi:hypothetical protein